MSGDKHRKKAMAIDPRRKSVFARSWPALGVLLGLFAGAPSVGLAADSAQVKDIRFGRHDAKVRIVLDVTAPARYTAKPSADHRSVSISLSGVTWAASRGRGLSGMAPLSAFTVKEEGDARHPVVEISGREPIAVLGSTLIEPGKQKGLYRIVIDLGPAGAIGAPVPNAKPAPEAPPLRTAGKPVPPAPIAPIAGIQPRPPQAKPGQPGATAPAAPPSSAAVAAPPPRPTVPVQAPADSAVAARPTPPPEPVAVAPPSPVPAPAAARIAEPAAVPAPRVDPVVKPPTVVELEGDVRPFVPQDRQERFRRAALAPPEPPLAPGELASREEPPRLSLPPALNGEPPPPTDTARPEPPLAPAAAGIPVPGIKPELPGEKPEQPDPSGTALARLVVPPSVAPPEPVPPPAPPPPPLAPAAAAAPAVPPAKPDRNQAALPHLSGPRQDTRKYSDDAIKALAEKGDVEAQLEMGGRIMDPQKGSHDMAEAMKWFRKAADAGSPLGAYNVGQFYRNGLGVAHDDVLAAFWYGEAARAGFAPAQLNYGIMELRGIGISANPEQGLEMIRLAAGQGHPQAQRLLDRIRSVGTEDAFKKN